MDKRNKAVGIILIVVTTLVFSVPFLIKVAIRQEYLEKGIYEVEKTFSHGGSFLETVFMICEPPSDKDELERVVINFIEENDIVQTIKARKTSDFGSQIDPLEITLIKLYFVKPSKSYPIGWKSGDHAGFFSGFITDHTIIIVRIPWDSTDTSDFEIIHRSEM